jgi:hypothetical protein
VPAIAITSAAPASAIASTRKNSFATTVRTTVSAGVEDSAGAAMLLAASSG